MRLRARFGGKMIAAVVILLAAAAVVSFFVYQQGMILARDFYIVGASSSAPEISDKRFYVIRATPQDGGIMLNNRKIDIFLTGTAIFSREDDRSQYALGAIKTYLEKRELARLGAEYPLAQAFPLRVEINYLKAGEGARVSAVSLADIVGQAQKVTSQPSRPVAGAPVQDISDKNTAADGPKDTAPALSDAEVGRQLSALRQDQSAPQFKAEFASNKQVIIPSLMEPPIPLAQVLLAFAYILPIFFISIFFTSGFIEEKLGRKINVLLAAPVTPFQVIIGKMLPYIGYSLLVVVLITLVLRGNLLLALAIFIPVILFIFAIYLGVALQYRSYRDQTFFSLVAVTGITGYLVFPAMFVGINDLSFVSPLTLAVQMYRGVPFTPYQYMLSAVPMLLVFVLAVAVGTRVFNEEYLLSFRPLHIKIREAIFFAMDRKHLAISAALFSLLFIPVVFMLEMGVITISFNLPRALALAICIFICVIIEEAAKSLTVAVTIERNLVKSWRQVLWLAMVSALFFFIGEKLLLFMSLKVIAESVFTTAVFAGNLLWLPLLVHTVCTAVVCLITYKTGIKGYPLALLAGSIIHGVYNLSLLGVFR